jgi:hypothetical protein
MDVLAMRPADCAKLIANEMIVRAQVARDIGIQPHNRIVKQLN